MLNCFMDGSNVNGSQETQERNEIKINIKLINIMWCSKLFYLTSFTALHLWITSNRFTAQECMI